MTVNERIRKVRKSLGLTIKEFAQTMGSSHGYLGGIELGDRPVNLRTIRIICLTYGIREEWLLTGKGEMLTDPAVGMRANSLAKKFEDLRPEFQDYAIEVIDRLIELQKKL
jgi:transcriptional regulator with XRE-family HTH domain